MARTVLSNVRLLLLIGIPIILLLLPKDFFDDGPPLCLSVLLLGEECIACGMTRACMYLIHFDFGGAYYWNALSFIVFPILAFIWGWWLWAEVKGRMPR
jgi:Protein of unknown function (DUF2752)